jgi:hypothetical protein
MMERWNTGLNKRILGLSCIIPSFHYSRVVLSNFGQFGIEGLTKNDHT